MKLIKAANGIYFQNTAPAVDDSFELDKFHWHDGSGGSGSVSGINPLQSKE